MFHHHFPRFTRSALLAALTAILLASGALAQRSARTLEVRDAWTRATAPGAPVAAGYLEVRNTGAASDRLVGASSPAAARVELHVMAREGGVMRMRPVEALEVPARGVLRLEPGGAHLMIVGPRERFTAGARVPLTLRFERGGELGVELEVRSMGAGAMHHHAH